jgi:hypothetical protein
VNAVALTHFISVSDKMYRKDTRQQCHLNYHICKNIVFCLLVISYYLDSFVFFYMQSTVNVPYHRVKAVQIVKQTSKEIVYTI